MEKSPRKQQQHTDESRLNRKEWERDGKYSPKKSIETKQNEKINKWIFEMEERRKIMTQKARIACSPFSMFSLSHCGFGIVDSFCFVCLTLKMSIRHAKHIDNRHCSIMRLYVRNKRYEMILNSIFTVMKQKKSNRFYLVLPY